MRKEFGGPPSPSPTLCPRLTGSDGRRKLTILSSSTAGTSRVGTRLVASDAGPCHDIRETPRPDGEGPSLGDSTRSATTAGGVVVAVASGAGCGACDGSGDGSGEAEGDVWFCCCC